MHKVYKKVIGQVLLLQVIYDVFVKGVQLSGGGNARPNQQSTRLPSKTEDGDVRTYTGYTDRRFK